MGYDHISQSYSKVFYTVQSRIPHATAAIQFAFYLRMRTVHVFSMSDLTNLLPGYGRGLSHSPDITSHVHNQSPNILLPTGRVERKLFLGPNVGFHTLVAHRWSWGFGETQASVFAQRALPGRGKVAFGDAAWLAGSVLFFALRKNNGLTFLPKHFVTISDGRLPFWQIVVSIFLFFYNLGMAI